MKYVNVYLCDRAYGGPEEGGWWFDYGLAQRSFPVATQRRAERILELCKRICACRNEDRMSDVSSVISEGRYEAWIEDEPAANYPALRPHYE
jgi:hypothetical protein